MCSKSKFLFNIICITLQLLKLLFYVFKVSPLMYSRFTKVTELHYKMHV
jgi:hypothetical protein